jgi:phenylalanyl-tRNA synthetase beta chain
MEFLSNNQSVEFPQKIFELGKITLLDEAKETKTRDEEWLSAATAHANANFTEIKSALDAFLSNFGVDWQIKEAAHPSFIEGRAGRVIVGGVDVGVVGEINPLVLEAWKLENPVAAFEVNLQKILEGKLSKGNALAITEPKVNRNDLLFKSPHSPKRTGKVDDGSIEHDKYLYDK